MNRKLSARQVDALTIIAHTGVTNEIDGRTLSSLRKRGLVELVADKGSTLLTVSGTIVWKSTIDRRRAAVFAKAESEAYEIADAIESGAPSLTKTFAATCPPHRTTDTQYAEWVVNCWETMIDENGHSVDPIVTRADQNAHGEWKAEAAKCRSFLASEVGAPVEEVPECVIAAAELTKTMYYTLITVNADVSHLALCSRPGSLYALERRGLIYRRPRHSTGPQARTEAHYFWHTTDLGKAVLAVRPTWHSA